jgi:hypothetical protein
MQSAGRDDKVYQGEGKMSCFWRATVKTNNKAVKMGKIKKVLKMVLYG